MEKRVKRLKMPIDINVYSFSKPNDSIDTSLASTKSINVGGCFHVKNIMENLYSALSLSLSIVFICNHFVLVCKRE